MSNFNEDISAGFERQSIFFKSEVLFLQEAIRMQPNPPTAYVTQGTMAK